MITVLSRNQILLAGLCSALALVLGYELVTEPAAADVPVLHWQPPSPAPISLAPSLPPLESFSAIDARPLFNPARKPLAVPQADAATTLPPPTDISLIGVIIEGDRRMALLHTPASSLEVSVGVGGTIDGWQVTAVEPDRIVLHSGTTDYPVALNAPHGEPAIESRSPQSGVQAPANTPPHPPLHQPETSNGATESGDQ
jgi:hypothetical protein